MADPYLGEIRPVGFNFAPVGWAFCDGSLLAISQNDALFNLLGTTYGGDGQNTFALPDLRSRVPVGAGSGPGLSSVQLGQLWGSEEVTLTSSQIPAHNHALQVSTKSATSRSAAGKYPGKSARKVYDTSVSGSTPANSSHTGSSLPHTNVQPVLVINYIIAVEGIFPSP
jgi:microcystin-dependent protein